jgi:hypothetical protein
MARPRLSFLQLRFIEELDKRDGVCALLAPYKAFCEERGLVLGTLREDALSNARLVRFFSEHERTLPDDLAEALLNISEVSGDDAHEALLGAAQRAGITLADRIRNGPTAMLAVHLFLHHRSLFDTARQRVQIDTVRNTTEYVGKPVKDFEPTEEHDDDLRERLARWFDARGRSQFVQILCERDGAAVWWTIAHGNNTRTELSLDANDRPNVTRRRPRTYDHAWFDARTGTLKIQAAHQGERVEYAQAIGEVYFGRENFFQLGVPVYDLSPLVERGREALDVAGIDGLESVRLREVTIDRKNAHGRISTEKAADLFTCVDLGDLDLGPGLLVAATLVLKFDKSRGGQRTVEIKPPFTVRFDRRLYGDLIDQFLTARGFRSVKENATVDRLLRAVSA